MPVFAYEAVDKSGQRVKKELDAASKDDAIKQLQATATATTPSPKAHKPEGRGDSKHGHSQGDDDLVPSGRGTERGEESPDH